MTLILAFSHSPLLGFYVQVPKNGNMRHPFPEVTSDGEVAGGKLKKFPARLLLYLPEYPRV